MGGGGGEGGFPKIRLACTNTFGQERSPEAEELAVVVKGLAEREHILIPYFFFLYGRPYSRKYYDILEKRVKLPVHRFLEDLMEKVGQDG